MKRIITSIIAAAACLAVGAQGICTINGHIADNQLADGTKLKKVYLTRTNEPGQTTTVATAKVKRGSYALKYELGQDEPVMQYTLTGFGEGKGIALFVEPGEVTVSTASAMQPEQSVVTGTSTNDTYPSTEPSAAEEKPKWRAACRTRGQARRGMARHSRRQARGKAHKGHRDNSDGERSAAFLHRAQCLAHDPPRGGAHPAP